MNTNCDFCDPTKFIERLVGENSDWYVVATLGQIVGGYVIAIPKVHTACMGALTTEQQHTLDMLTHNLYRALSLEYSHNTADIRSVTMFEHGIVGASIKHAHLHILPTTLDITAQVRADFPDADFEELSSVAELRERYAQRADPYLFWTLPNGTAMVCWNPPAPTQYLRLITAKLLGYPERGNWRTMDPHLDQQLWHETINRLTPYVQGG